MAEDRISQLEQQLLTAQRRAEELEARAVKAERAAERASFEADLRVAAIEAGAIPDAVPDLLAGAVRRADWKRMDRGEIVRLRDGIPELDDLGNYVTPQRWMARQKKALPGYFQDGAKPAARSDQPPNPWTDAHWNKTEQWKIARVSMDEARKLAQEAGSSLDATQPPSKIQR